MWQGETTDELHQKCLISGFCERHLQEYGKCKSPDESQELYRKSLLAIRLSVLNPFFFDIPYTSVRMIGLAESFKLFSSNNCVSKDGMKSEKKDLIVLFDSVVTYTLCFLSKVCCCAGLFMDDSALKDGDEVAFLQELISKKTIGPREITPFVSLVKKSFSTCNGNIVDTASLLSLLCVREMKFLRLTTVLREFEKKMTNNDPQIATLTKRGNDEFQSGKFEQAISTYTTALKLSPYNSALLTERSKTYIELGFYKEAELDGRAAIAIDPTWNKVYVSLLNSLWKQDSFEMALAVVNFGLFSTQHRASEAAELKRLKQEAGQKCVTNSVARTVETPIVNPLTNKVEVGGAVEMETDADIPDLTDSSSSEGSDLQDFEDEEPVQSVVNSMDVDIGPQTIDVSTKTPAESAPMRKSKDVEKQNVGATLVSNHIESSKKVVGTDNKKEKTPPSSSVAQVISKKNSEEVEMKCEKLITSLTQASEAAIEGSFHIAARNYLSALSMTKASLDHYGFEENDIVQLKFAYGLACCETGAYEDLQKSITTFKEIISDHPSIIFPGASYGLGLAYFKLNRFKEACSYLKKVSLFLEKKIRCPVYVWPLTSKVIPETKSETLKKLTDDLMLKAINPPVPDAMCRYAECLSNPPIYYTDPDFKGFNTLNCSEHCILHYHPGCWKALKTLSGLSDKEYLDQTCLTPDCEGTVVTVKCTNKEGNIEKTFESEDNNRSKQSQKQKKSKLEKKFEIKEHKKRIRQVSITLSEGKMEPGECLEEFAVPEPKVKDGTPHNVSSDLSNQSQSSQSSTSVPTVTTNTQPVFVLKKDTFEEEHHVQKAPKQKDRKKAKKNTLSIDEFRGPNFTNRLCFSNEYQMRINRLDEDKRYVEGPQQPWSNYAETQSFQDHQSELYHNAVIPQSDSYGLEEFSTFPPCHEDEATRTSRETIYAFFESYLREKGPLLINDPGLLEEIDTCLTPETKEIIEQCGDLKDFLIQSTKFTLVKNYVCVVDDVIKAYNMTSRSRLEHAADVLDDFDFDNDSEDEAALDETNPVNLSGGMLNPDAIEYKPKTYNCDKTSKGQNDSSDSSESLLSMASSFRQPIISYVEETNTEDVKKNAKYIPKSYAEKVSAPKTASTVTKKEPIVTKKEPTVTKKEPTVEEISREANRIIKQYFCDGVSKEQRSLINSNLMPYAIVEVPKTGTKCVQSTEAEALLVSRSALKTDKELKEIQELLDTSKAENYELINKITQLEEKLIYNNDLAIQYKNTTTVEMKTLREELQDKNQTLQKNMDELKFREDQEKQLQHLFNNAIDDLKRRKQEKEEAIEENKKLRFRVAEKEKIIEQMQTDADSMKMNNDLLKARSSDTVDMLQAKILELQQHVRTVEVDALILKKSEFLKRLDDKSKSAELRVKEVEDGLIGFGSNIEPHVFSGVTTLIVKLNDYINHLSVIRLNFEVNIDEQIQECRNGTPLSDLKPLPVIEFPEMPTFSNKLPAAANYEVPFHTAALAGLTTALHNSGINTPNMNSFGLGTATAVSAAQHISQPKPVPNLMPAPGAFNRFTNLQPKSLLPGAPPGLQYKTPENYLTMMNLVNPSGAPDATPRTFSALNTAPMPNPSSADRTQELSVTIPEPMLPRLSHLPSSNESSMLDLSGASGRDTPIDLGYTIPADRTKDDSHESAKQYRAQKQESKQYNSYEKLMLLLQSHFPAFAPMELVEFIKEIRRQNNNKLSGISVEAIISKVYELISNQRAANMSVPNRTRLLPSSLVNRNFGTPKLEKVDDKVECPWANLGSNGGLNHQWSDENTDRSCIICFEDMTPQNAYRVDCGHKFHSKCIREWLDKSSNCPICRVHLLLPEDYPSLS